MDDVKSVIVSLKGCALSSDERSFFRDANPLGFILFARNCETREQLRALTDDLKDTLGRDCPILIDQEGGRVQRLKPPVWGAYKPMKHFGDMAASDMGAAKAALRDEMAALTQELVEVGVNVNCAPVLDVLSSCTHDAIGDRAFADDPEIVAALGQVVCEVFLEAGVMPVLKHIPGHGRGKVDSHKDLPCVVDAVDDLNDSDFNTFRIVSEKYRHAPVWGMVAHIVYDAIDPDHPASVSPTIIADIIRGAIGFDGFLVSDDLDMHALKAYGSIAERAALSVEAGCDAALYCAGDLKVMEEIVKTVPNLSAKAQKRLQNAASAPIIAA